jgi:hypothetical protein
VHFSILGFVLALHHLLEKITGKKIFIVQ